MFETNLKRLRIRYVYDTTDIKKCYSRNKDNFELQMYKRNDIYSMIF
jgi:hypothetical protein